MDFEHMGFKRISDVGPYELLGDPLVIGAAHGPAGMIMLFAQKILGREHHVYLFTRLVFASSRPLPPNEQVFAFDTGSQDMTAELEEIALEATARAYSVEFHAQPQNVRVMPPDALASLARWRKTLWVQS